LMDNFGLVMNSDKNCKNKVKKFLKIDWTNKKT
jgi:hypothetical protein